MKKSIILSVVAVFLAVTGSYAQKFNGLDMNLGNLSRLSDAKTRSISPENFTGEKGKGGMAEPALPNTRNVNNASWAARDLGKTWKVNPFITINSGETVTIAEMEGPGAIQHIWMTPTGVWRWTIIRIYWDDETTPSVECPIADFFCMGWNEYTPLVSLPVCVNPGSAFNCYWQMPFRKKCKITMENVNDRDGAAWHHKSEIEDRITGLDAGADDYLSKPFAMGELLARIRSMTRRGKEYTPKKLNAGSVTLNVNEQELVSSNSIRLAGMEAKMMEYFMLNFNKEISTKALFDHVWGNEDEGNEELVFVYVSYLRQKLRAIDADIKIDGDENGYILCDI